MDIEMEESNQEYLEDDSSACSSALSYYLDHDENELLLDFDSNSERPFFDIRSLSISPIQAVETSPSVSPNISPRGINSNNIKSPIAIAMENAIRSDEFRNSVLTNNSMNFDYSYKNKTDTDNIKFRNNFNYTDENRCHDIVSIFEINAQIAPLNGSVLDKSRKSNSNLETIFEDLYLDTPPKSKRKTAARATKKKLRKN